MVGYPCCCGEEIFCLTCDDPIDGITWEVDISGIADYTGANDLCTHGNECATLNQTYTLDWFGAQNDIEGEEFGDTNTYQCCWLVEFDQLEFCTRQFDEDYMDMLVLLITRTRFPQQEASNTTNIQLMFKDSTHPNHDPFDGSVHWGSWNFGYAFFNDPDDNASQDCSEHENWDDEWDGNIPFQYYSGSPLRCSWQTATITISQV